MRLSFPHPLLLVLSGFSMLKVRRQCSSIYPYYVCMSMYARVCMHIYEIAHNRAIRPPCHPSHSIPLALILPRGINDTMYICMYVCMYVCIFIKLHITAQSGPVIRVIVCMYVCMYLYLLNCTHTRIESCDFIVLIGDP